MNTRKRSELTLINNSQAQFTDEKFLEVLQLVELHEDLQGKAVNLVLSDDGSIRDLNRKFRGKNSLTDVISFPSQQDYAPFLGDIIIDIEIADRQKGDRSLLDELQYLFLHGLLHLIGYDHIAVEAEKIMKEKEEKYFSLLKEND